MKTLNLGAGTLLKKDCINFDCQIFTRGDLKTDIIGKIEDITTLFKKDIFDTILCFHVLEHFTLKAARKMLADCYIILKLHGTLIMEAPDVLGSYALYKNDLPKLMNVLYSDQVQVDAHGDCWSHHFGYTGDTMNKRWNLLDLKSPMLVVDCHMVAQIVILELLE